MTGSERLRLFCALRLPRPTVERLAAWQASALPRGRLVAADSLHITLAFLGSRPASDMPAIVDALRVAAIDAGELRLRVRRYRETRSVGMLVLDDQSGRAAAFAAQLHDGLSALGVYGREARPWLPHVTVLRFRERPHLQPPLPELGEVAPSDAAVFMSHLRPAGALYTRIDDVPLGGR
ncbi:MAG TPA: RNA 2',3'-cyclic phosphodiesterase [Gaiellaceae bacterium]